MFRRCFASLLLLSWSRPWCMCQPANDQCENAVGPLTIDGDMVSSSTIGGTTDVTNVALFRCGAEAQIFDVDTPGVWFTVKGTVSTLRASTCAEETNFDNRITIFKGDTCEERACVESGVEEDPNCTSGSSSFVDWLSEQDETYYIFVHDARATVDSGNFGLTVKDVTSTPTNNECAGAQPLDSGKGIVGTTAGAALGTGVQCKRCIGCIQNYPGVWYKLPQQVNETKVTVTTCSLQAYFELTILTGTVCGELNCLDLTPDLGLTCEDGVGFASQVTWTAMPGQDYYLYLNVVNESEDWEVGNFQLMFEGEETTDEPGAETETSASWNTTTWFCSLIFLLASTFLQ